MGVHLVAPELGGSSGAVAGVLGAYFLLFPSRCVGLSLFFCVLKIPAFIFLGLWLVFQVLAVSDPGGIAYEAHVGGFVTGAVGAFLMRGRVTVPLTQRRSPERALER